MSTKYGSRKDPNFILSEEAATEQVIQLLDYYDIDVEALIEGDKKGALALERSLDLVARAVRKGMLEVNFDENNKIKVVQHLSGGGELAYREVNAVAKLAMDSVSDSAGYKRIYAFMGSLAGIGVAGIKKLDVKDLAVVEVLGTVFSNA